MSKSAIFLILTTMLTCRQFSVRATNVKFHDSPSGEISLFHVDRHSDSPANMQDRQTVRKTDRTIYVTSLVVPYFEIALLKRLKLP